MYNKEVAKVDQDVGVGLCGLAFGENICGVLTHQGGGLVKHCDDAWKSVSKALKPFIIKNRKLGNPPESPLCISTGDPEALSLAAWRLKRRLREHSDCDCYFMLKSLKSCLLGGR